MTFLLPRPAPVFRADPARGRVFTSARMVQSTEVTPAGRLRLDALARFLQQAAEDDVGDAGWDGSYLWLLRRVALAIRGFPAHRERISLRTYCSATGPRWAERTTVVAGPEGELIQSTAIWVAVSAADGRPVTLGEEFHRVYGPSTEGRQVSARLSHPGLPGSAGGGPGRCAPWTSTPPATSTTPSTGPPWRMSWPAWTGCPATRNSNTTGPSCPGPSRSW